MQVKLTDIRISEPIRFGEGNLDEMKETLRNCGMIHPIAVKQISKNHHSTEEDSPRYELIAGFLRYKAAQQLGWTEIPVTVIHPQDNLHQFDMRLEENIKRRDLNPLEICELLLQRKRLWEEKNGKIVNGQPTTHPRVDGELSTNVESFYEETERVFRKCRTNIYTFLQLKDLDPDLKVKVESGEMYYRKALEEHCVRHSKDKNKNRKREIHLPKPPIDLSWLSHDFQKTFWQMGGFYEAVMRIKNRPMNLSEIPEDQILGLMNISQEIQHWLQSFDSHLQEIMLQRTGMSLPNK